MLMPQSQLVLRNLSDLQGKILIVEPMRDLLAAELAAAKLDFQCFSSDFAVAESWRTFCAVQFAAQLQNSEQYDTVVLFYPKSKELLALLLSGLQPCLKADSQVYLVGDNKGGIKSLANHAVRLGLHAHKLDNAKHSLWFALNGLQNKPIAKVPMQQFQLQHQQWQLKFCSLPGVFNHGQLDAGTALLLENLKHVSQGTVLDFACGAGIIGALLKQAHPAITLFASDVSALAIESTNATLALNQLTATVIAADGMPPKTPMFDHIVTNPPFHTGLKTDISIAEQFILQSKSRLKPSGTLTLVANAHLPYAEWLKASFTEVKELARRQGFVVYSCRQR